MTKRSIFKLFGLLVLIAGAAEAAIPFQYDNYAGASYNGLAHAGAAVDGAANSYWLNPGLFDTKAPYSATLSQAFIPGTGVSVSELSGTYSLNERDLISGGINYENYGEFTSRDLNGNDLGEFTAAQYQVMLGFHRQISASFRAGLQGIYYHDRIADSRESAAALKFGAVYTFGPRDDQAAFSALTDGEELLWRLAYSHKLEYLPLRLAVDWRSDELFSSEDEESEFSDKLLDVLGMMSLGGWAEASEDLDIYFGVDLRRLDLRAQNFGLADLLTGVGIGGQYDFGDLSLQVSSFVYGNLGALTSMSLSYSPRKL